MNNVLKELIKIYEPGDTDWMMDKTSRKNPFTYHHIKEKRNKGDKTLENGAILTKRSHAYLNYLYHTQKGNYNNLNTMFQELNDSKMPPTEEYFDKVLALLEKIVEDDAEKKKNKHYKERTITRKLKKKQ